MVAWFRFGTRRVGEKGSKFKAKVQKGKRSGREVETNLFQMDQNRREKNITLINMKGGVWVS